MDGRHWYAALILDDALCGLSTLVEAIELISSAVAYGICLRPMSGDE